MLEHDVDTAKADLVFAEQQYAGRIGRVRWERPHPGPRHGDPRAQIQSYDSAYPRGDGPESGIERIRANYPY